MQTCLFCGHTVQLVHVHGHYQCPVCFTNALPCCDGDNCDTNMLLSHASQTPNAHTVTGKPTKKDSTLQTKTNVKF